MTDRPANTTRDWLIGLLPIVCGMALALIIAWIVQDV